MISAFIALGLMQASPAQRLWPVSPQDASDHLIRRVDPEYPQAARAAKVEGIVTLKVYLSKSGTVTHALDWTRLREPAFTQAALDAVKQWQYRPFFVNGEPTEAVTVVDIPFLLQPRERTEEEEHRQQEIYLASLDDDERAFLYRGPGEAISFSPDGRSLAVANREKGTVVWDTDTGRLRLDRPGTALASALAFHPNSRWLAWVGNDNKTIKLWDVISNKQLPSLSGHPSEVYAVAFVGDGGKVASVSRDGTLKLWDSGSGRELQSMQVGTMQGAILSSNGLLATQSPQDPTRRYPPREELKLWRVTDGRLLRTILVGMYQGIMAFSPDGALLACAWEHWDPVSKASSRGIRIYEVATGRERGNIIFDAKNFRPLSLAFSPDGRWVALGQESVTGPGDVGLWEVATGRQLLHFAADGSGDKFVAFSADGQWLAYTLSRYVHEQKVKLCGVATRREPPGGGSELMLRAGEPNYIGSLAFADNGSTLAWISGYDTVRLWDAARASELVAVALKDVGIPDLALSPDGKLFATLNYTNEAKSSVVKLWNAQQGEELRTLQITKPGEAIMELAFGPDSRTLVLGSRCTVTLFDVATGREIRTLLTTPDSTKDQGKGCNGDDRAPLTSLYRLAFSPDGRRLLVSRMHSMELWDLATGQRSAELTLAPDSSKRFGQGVFSSDGQSLIMIEADWKEADWKSATKDLVVRNAATLHELRRIQQSEVSVFLLSSHDGHVDTLINRNMLKVWDIATGKILRTLSLDLPESPISSLAFSKDGRWLAVAQSGIEYRASAGQNSIDLWDLSTGRHSVGIPALPIRWLHAGQSPPSQTPEQRE